MSKTVDNTKSLSKTISTSDYTRNYLSKISKKIKNNPIFRFINTEEDEDNDQTFWPFTTTGKLRFSR